MSMGKITALPAQARNPNRVNVYLDGDFAFGLDRLVAAWLKVGMELSAEKIADLQAQDTVEGAYQKALHFISYRPRSEMEIRKRLVEKDIDEPVIEAVLERLKQAQWIDDKQFARTWVENRSAFRPRSHRMLRYELKQKGVEEEHIHQALLEAEEEPKLAYEAGKSYARRLAGLEWEVFRKRLGGYLSRRGFTYGTIAPVIRQIWDENHSTGQ